MEWHWQLMTKDDTVTMTVEFRAIYRFNIVNIRIPMKCFKQKIIQKSICNLKDFSIFYLKMNIVEELILLNAGLIKKLQYSKQSGI